MPDMQATILQAVRLRGSRILADKEHLCIVLEDLSPELRDDLAFIEKVYNNDVGKLLLQACTAPTEKKGDLLKAADVYLDEENGRNPKWRKRFLSYFEAAVAGENPGNSPNTGDTPSPPSQSPDGKCVQVNADGTTITGTRHGGIWQGPFKKAYPNGAYFEGSMTNGKVDEALRYVDENGAVLDGTWSGGVWNGPFLKTYPDGSYYKGSYQQGVVSGTLEHRDKHGNVFTCIWKNGNWNGWGKYLGIDGSTLVARWVDGEVSGYGAISYQDGSSYEGEVANFRKNGRGVLKFKSGGRLTATFSNDKIAPGEKAVIAFPDGSSYSGNWNGAVNGRGIFISDVCSSFQQISCRAHWEEGGIRDSSAVLEITLDNGDSYTYVGNIQGFQMTGKGELYEQEKYLPKECLVIGEWNNGRFAGKRVSRAVRNAEKQLSAALDYIARVIPLAGGPSRVRVR